MKWIKELRVTHYLKNCLIFLPVFFDGKLFIGASWGRLAIGFVAFCLGASAIYLINDIKDLEKDRKHPTKCKRPIAAGEIPVSQAVVAATSSYSGCSSKKSIISFATSIGCCKSVSMMTI